MASEAAWVACRWPPRVERFLIAASKAPPMTEGHATVRTKKPLPRWLVVLAAVFPGALVGAVIDYVTRDPCVPDPNVFLDCLFDEPEVSAFNGATLGLFIGTCAGLLLFVPRTRQFKDWRGRAGIPG